ncbi:hypothetical protein NDI56_16830 [Haloarcula sp. S1CR25-12]|uniref:DUF7344 domain-containing protein n=1 Tax=Haloarcula saliterrae TaxID=2950534 RepID=A0ABU2FH86_9EURY|nr:hypothetical protein [Haloarcula sp. S1CR25-12]MDS0261065.1 hypothetical protein [Haloarcula sp. S1CR25-12]
MLEVLAERTAPVELKVLAVAVATRENESDVFTGETLKRVASTLHHVHLPKMADFGMVDYDTNTNRIESCP